ncbi:MAG: hypothetical protein LBR06_01595 [Bacteroidales bacterium]|jgi:hypothetical protein|nr:hypothetical protein [Bacteroidales bacterium]
MRFILAGIISICITSSVYAQGPGANAERLLGAHVRQDSRITALLRNHVEHNRKKNSIDGWRVEIFARSGEGAMESANSRRTEFLRQFPGETVYVTFVSPDFKVRVGDYRTKSEAMKMKQKLTGLYPNAFIAPDQIQFPRLASAAPHE